MLTNRETKTKAVPYLLHFEKPCFHTQTTQYCLKYLFKLLRMNGLEAVHAGEEMGNLGKRNAQFVVRG